MKTREQIYRDLDSRYEVAKNAYMSGLLPLTAARIRIGTADWKDRLAYRFPRLFGWLDEQARMDAIDPHNSPAAIQHRELEAMKTRAREAFRQYTQQNRQP